MRTKKQDKQWELALETTVGKKLTPSQLKLLILEARDVADQIEFLKVCKISKPLNVEGNPKFTEEELKIFYKVVWSVYS